MLLRLSRTPPSRGQDRPCYGWDLKSPHSRELGGQSALLLEAAEPSGGGAQWEEARSLLQPPRGGQLCSTTLTCDVLPATGQTVGQPTMNGKNLSSL